MSHTTDQQLPKDGQEDVFIPLSNQFGENWGTQLNKGITKYGRTLQTFNGRNAGQDAFEEWFDLGAYLMQLKMEHQRFKELLVECQAYLLGYKDTLESPSDLPELLKQIEGVL